MATEIEEDIVTKDGVAHKHTHKHVHKQKVEKMSEPVNVFAGQPMMGGYGYNSGDGLGGGLLGAILASSLFNNNRGFSGNHEGCVTPANLSAQLAGVTDSQMNTAVLQGIGQIQASVPLAEAQVQLALAGSTGEIRSHLGQVENGLVAGQSITNKAVADAIAASLASQNNINVNILQTSTANLMATKDAQSAITLAVSTDGEKTRALITANQLAELNRLAAERQDEILELRSERRRDADRNGIEINMINNQNQNQLQFQQQAQILQQLTHGLIEVGQIAKATNQNVLVGNTGVTTTGPQTANPTNVKV